MATRKFYLEFGMYLVAFSGKHAVYLRSPRSRGWHTATSWAGELSLYSKEEINTFFHGVDGGMDRNGNQVQLLGKWTLAPKNSKNKRAIQFEVEHNRSGYRVRALHGGLRYNVREGMCDEFETVTGIRVRDGHSRIVTLVPARSTPKKRRA